MFTVTIFQLENGNYLVNIYKDNELMIERSYEDLKDVISLIPLVFLPNVK